MLVWMDLKNLALRPNCLITKYPLLFVPGPRGLFFNKKPFLFLPEFLYQHGYQVQILNLPSRNLENRKKAFQKWIEKETKKINFIFDPKAKKELADLIPLHLKASFTEIQSETLKERADYERFLDHCIELAENEWQENL